MNTLLLFLNDLARFLRTEFGTDRYPVGECLGKPSDLWPDLVGEEFGGGYDRAEPGKVRTHARVAIVGAMNPALIREVHGRGVSTGKERRKLLTNARSDLFASLLYQCTHHLREVGTVLGAKPVHDAGLVGVFFVVFIGRNVADIPAVETGYYQIKPLLFS